MINLTRIIQYTHLSLGLRCLRRKLYVLYDYHNWHICLSSTPRNSQASFKLGMSYEPPCFVEESDQAEINRGACVILNTTAIRDKFRLINKRFNLLFAKRAFVHWYVGQGRVKFGDD